jgi:signal transduction histidine kinase
VKQALTKSSDIRFLSRLRLRNHWVVAFLMFAVTAGAHLYYGAHNDFGIMRDVLHAGVIPLLLAGAVWYLIRDRDRVISRLKQKEVQTAKDDLLSLASHQLRTPATVVKQYVGMTLQGYAGKLNKQQTKMLQAAYDSNELQLETITQLLYVARLDAGRIHMRKQKVDIGNVVGDVLQYQAHAIDSRRQTVDVKLPKTHRLHIWADSYYIRMVLDNLISNAIKYTPVEGRITISARQNRDKARVTVSDTGVGIPAGSQKAIFEKFTRIANELSNEVNGSGVGLYLTRQIVDHHGGKISVSSRPGEGSAFAVDLPMGECFDEVD